MDEQGRLHTKGDTRNKLLGRILGAAAHMKKGEDQPRRKTRDFRKRGPERIEVYTGIFDHLLISVTHLSFLRNEFVI